MNENFFEISCGVVDKGLKKLNKIVKPGSCSTSNNFRVCYSTHSEPGDDDPDITGTTTTSIVPNTDTSKTTVTNSHGPTIDSGSSSKRNHFHQSIESDESKRSVIAVDSEQISNDHLYGNIISTESNKAVSSTSFIQHNDNPCR